MALVTALRADLLGRYGRPGMSPPDAGELVPPGGLFLVGYMDEVAVACGGYRRLDDGTAEIKRMYVVPAARRRGLSRVVLAELERRAGTAGYRSLRLETGELQPEAVGLYESAGYSLIPCFGEYINDPQSLCYEKALPAPSDTG